MIRSLLAPIASIAMSLVCACGVHATAVTPAGKDETVAADRLAWLATCKDWDDWDKPAPPWRIHGNTWYVGTCGITAILITGSAGSVLIDTGTEKGARVVARNIRALGIRMSNVRLLLNSHEHLDHVGGTAWMQQRTGALVVTSPEAASVLASGIPDAADPQFGLLEPFPAVRIDQVLYPDESVQLGDIRLVPVETPGHTPGALSWQWRSCDGNDCRWIVYADSLSPVSRDGYRYSDHAWMVAKFRAGIARLAALDCDIVLTPHPSSSDMPTRMADAAGLDDPDGCKTYAASIARRLDARIAKEADGGMP